MSERIQSIDHTFMAEVRKFMRMYEDKLKIGEGMEEADLARELESRVWCIAKYAREAMEELADIREAAGLERKLPASPLKPGESDGYYETGELKKVYTNGNDITRVSR